MLCLSQVLDNPADDIIIRVGNEVIVIQVCDIQRNKVRLGLTASDAVTINRRSIDERIQSEQALADEPVPFDDHVTPLTPTPIITDVELDAIAAGKGPEIHGLTHDLPAWMDAQRHRVGG